MSDSSEKGQSLEKYIAKTLQRKLGARVKRDSRSGAGSHQKMDITDYYQDTPLDIEAKNHKTIKIGEWWRQAINGASFNRVPTVVFQLDDEVLAVVRFSDLVDMLVETKDANATIADLKRPITVVPKPLLNEIDQRVEAVKAGGVKECRNGHIIAPGQFKCFAKGCPYSAGYKPKKAKK
jgi:hypothetical protein